MYTYDIIMDKKNKKKKKKGTPHNPHNIVSDAICCKMIH